MSEVQNTIEQQSLYEFFQNEIGQTARDLGTNIPPTTQIYVANLLTRFVKSDQVFVTMEGQRQLEPLAFILKRALEQSEHERIHTLKHLGDMALYTSGFFSERIEMRGVQVDYYIEMGGMAYSSVADLSSNRAQVGTWRDLYSTLSDHFRDLVSLLWAFDERTSEDNSVNLLELYKRWEKTQSRRLEEQLLRRGFILAPQSTTCS